MKNFSAIIGLGQTGLSCVRYLAKKNIPFIVLDTREKPPSLEELQKEFPTVELYLGEFNADVLLQAKELIISPGVSLLEPAIAAAIKQGIPAIGDIELFARAITKPVVAITGTNGKGTVTTLVGEMARAANLNVLVGGNIGTPVLDLLQEIEPDLYVLEISSFQLDTTFSLHPQTATILNITEDHLDRHGTMKAYIAAKQRVYLQAKNCVWNRDDEKTYPKTNSEMNKISFGLDKPKNNEFGICKKENDFYLAFGEECLLSVDELKIKGKHNWSDALAALAIGHTLNFPLSGMLKSLIEFKGLKHRCEWVGEKNNIIWCDDSKGTNVGATTAAIQGLGETINGKIILIAGGLGKDADFSPLKPVVAEFVKQVILMGKDAPILAELLSPVVAIQHVKDMPEAVNAANLIAKAGDVVLLSPACASWDMFRDYGHRGDVFQEAVKDILQEL